MPYLFPTPAMTGGLPARPAVAVHADAGHPLAYALCRPPGHHATRAGFGGSCYLNNAAVAAESLRHSGHPRVAVIDIDAHHGNGTAAIFYGRSDVLYGSVHVEWVRKADCTALVVSLGVDAARDDPESRCSSAARATTCPRGVD